MDGTEANRKLEADLIALLAEAIPDLTVRVEHSTRWNRPCATFRWGGFAGLLPEERFHRLVQAIPEPFRASRMRGVVWLELGPKESVDAFLKLPRSDDVAAREAVIYAGLRDAKFFETLRGALGRSPQKACQGGFAATEDALRRQKVAAGRITEAKLLFIRHGVYCDCQVLQTVEPELAKLYAGAA